MGGDGKPEGAFGEVGDVRCRAVVRGRVEWRDGKVVRLLPRRCRSGTIGGRSRGGWLGSLEPVEEVLVKRERTCIIRW